MNSYYKPSQKKEDQIITFKGYILNLLENEIKEATYINSELTLYVDADNLVKVIRFLKDNYNSSFKQLSYITAVDYPEREKRFDIIYNLLSLKNNMRIKVITQSNESTPVPSITNVFYNADWLEREIWDMFGIVFVNHKDLRRLLTDFGFEGHPLRKDFPLTGFVEAYYCEDNQKVMYKPNDLAHAYRDFSYSNPWLKGTEVEAFYNNQKEKEENSNNN